MKNCKELLVENRAWAEQTFKKIDKKLQTVTARNWNRIVDGLDDTTHRRQTLPPTAWTAGFWGGLNYMLYEYTKCEAYLKTAKEIERQMDDGLRQYEELHHDVGFMWHILSGAGYRITGDENSKLRNLYAASTLFSRFVLSGGYIRAWNEHHFGPSVDDWTIIDCLMNIPQLYWASREIGDDRFKQVAMAHADMALIDHLREDGSVVHIVEHDRETGEVVKNYGGQGYDENSSWSRGQSWALYGFILSYIHTKEERYLDGAKKVAHYFIANCCDDWLPRIDFRAPSEPVYYDATAGAVAACGLIEIAKNVGEHEGGMYMNAAINILRAMDERFMDYDPDHDEMLTHGSGSYPVDGNPKKTGVHRPIIYGDYFYTEAILKLLGSEFLPW